MDGIKSLAIGVCTTLIAFGVISLLVPEGSLNKPIKSLLSVALIAVIVGSVSGLKVDFDSIQINKQTVSETTENLIETVTMQEIAVTESTVQQYIDGELNKNGITDAEITVLADISDKGDIYITEVNVVCEKGQSEKCQSIMNNLNINAKISERE